MTTTRTIYETPKKKERAPQTKYIRNLKVKDYNETKPGEDAGKNASYSSCGDHTIRRITASLWYIHATAIVLLFACRWQILHCVSRTYHSCVKTLSTMTSRKTKTSWMHDINTVKSRSNVFKTVQDECWINSHHSYKNTHLIELFRNPSEHIKKKYAVLRSNGTHKTFISMCYNRISRKHCACYTPFHKC